MGHIAKQIMITSAISKNLLTHNILTQNTTCVREDTAKENQKS